MKEACRRQGIATPDYVVAETEEVLAFHHSRPFWPVHLVVIPKAHTPSLVDLGDSGEILLAKDH